MAAGSMPSPIGVWMQPGQADLWPVAPSTPTDLLTFLFNRWSCPKKVLFQQIQVCANGIYDVPALIDAVKRIDARGDLFNLKSPVRKI